MKKIMYTNNEGRVCIVNPAPREHFDRFLRVPHTVVELVTVDEKDEEGNVVQNEVERTVETTRPLTDNELEQHIWDRSVPLEFIESARWIEEDDIPNTREFRNAWVNLTEDTRVDVCATKARDLALEELRARRNKELEVLDKKFIIALERGEDVTEIKGLKQELRDITNPLKDLPVEGVVNDEALLQTIRDLRDVVI